MSAPLLHCHWESLQETWAGGPLCLIYIYLLKGWWGWEADGLRGGAGEEQSRNPRILDLQRSSGQRVFLAPTPASTPHLAWAQRMGEGRMLFITQSLFPSLEFLYQKKKEKKS